MKPSSKVEWHGPTLSRSLELRRNGKYFRVVRLVRIEPPNTIHQVFYWETDTHNGNTTEHDLGIFGHMALLLKGQKPPSYRLEAEPGFGAKHEQEKMNRPPK